MKEPRDNFFFRKIVEEDLSEIQEISSGIWDGDDYSANLAPSWIESPKGYFYGIFLNEEAEKLVAYARIEFRGSNYAWMEGGRVHPDYQKRGYGLILTQHAIDYAITQGVKSIQYSTYSENIGSISLAKGLGLNQIDFMVFLQIQYSKIDREVQNLIISNRDGDISLISNFDAFTLLQKLLPNSNQNVNVGWVYLPLEEKYFLEKAKNYLWYTNSSKTALLKAEPPDFSDSHEKSESGKEWLTIYGDARTSQDILLLYLNLKSKETKLTEIRIVVARELVNGFKILGFQYTEDRESGILLFERLLKNEKNFSDFK